MWNATNLGKFVHEKSSDKEELELLSFYYSYKGSRQSRHHWCLISERREPRSLTRWWRDWVLSSLGATMARSPVGEVLPTTSGDQAVAPPTGLPLKVHAPHALSASIGKWSRGLLVQPSFYYNSTLNVKRFYRDKLQLASYTAHPILCDTPHIGWRRHQESSTWRRRLQRHRRWRREDGRKRASHRRSTVRVGRQTNRERWSTGERWDNAPVGPGGHGEWGPSTPDTRNHKAERSNRTSKTKVLGKWGRRMVGRYQGCPSLRHLSVCHYSLRSYFPFFNFQFLSFLFPFCQAYCRKPTPAGHQEHKWVCDYTCPRTKLIRGCVVLLIIHMLFHNIKTTRTCFSSNWDRNIRLKSSWG